MKSLVLILSWLVLLAACQKSEIKISETDGFSLVSLAALPSVLTESSGLEMTDGGNFCSFNDGKGLDELYIFDVSGKLKTTVKIKNGKNTDWEDIARDETGHFYIGDFGNNDNDRRDLAILKISNPPTDQANSEAVAEKINFTFPDQTAFPPPENARHFDTEAMFARDGWLYILTKSRTKPFVGKTRLYRLPNVPGTHTAEFLAEILTDSDEKKGQITAADLSPDGSVLALLSNERLYFFKNFTGNDFFSGTLERNDLPINRQMEGLVFQDNCTLFLTNEAKPGEAGMLFKVKICQ